RAGRRAGLRREAAGPLAAEDGEEGARTHGVERRAGLRLDQRERPFPRPRLAVRAPARDGVVDVADREDAGLERDRLAGQAVRVPLAVDPLVVGEDDRDLLAEAADVGEDVC